jgi:hypothetical protein
VATATRVFTVTTVAVSSIVAVLIVVGLHGSWAQKRADREALATALSVVAGPEDRVMSIDASGIEYVSGHGGVVSPNDPIDTDHEVALAYKIEWLILERDSIVRSMAPILAGMSRPSWIGPPILAIPAADGGIPRAALYPVCLSGSDQRCAVVAVATPTEARP